MPSAITRTKTSSGFRYSLGSKPVDTTTRQWIEDLKIPPAWKQVEISHSKRAKVLAKGIDGAGRTQAIYNPTFRKKQERLKFDRILRFAEHLPTLRKAVDKDMRRKKLSKEKVAATAVSLIDHTYFRVGNTESAKQEHYGVSTLRSKHVTLQSEKIVFEFTGKSGQEHTRIVEDRQLARIIKQLDESPGYDLFRYQHADGSWQTLSNTDINAYIKEHTGDDFTAKDFRTWGGTMHAISILASEQDSSQTTDRQKHLTSCIKAVAEKLGNTPAVAKSSYIDPRIIEAYTAGTSIQKIAKTVETMKPRKYMSKEELYLLHFLRSLPSV